MQSISIYTDGACRPNPGLGGVGAVVIAEGYYKEISKRIGRSTNNRAEIQAVIEGLSSLDSPEKAEVTLYTDSKLVRGFLVWGYRAKLNKGLVARMRAYAKKCGSLKVVWVKGHNGNHLNERADALAGDAIKGLKTATGKQAHTIRRSIKKASQPDSERKAREKRVRTYLESGGWEIEKQREAGRDQSLQKSRCRRHSKEGNPQQCTDRS